MNWNAQHELNATFESDEREVKQLLADLPSCAREAVNLPERFWRKQRIGIQAAIATRPAPRPRTALAFGTALLVLIGALLVKDSANTHNSQSARDIENSSDEQLLLKVEYTLENDVPVALEPAALLAEEMQGNRTSSQGDQE